MVDICDEMIEGEEKILVTALLESNSALSWSMKDEFPVLSESRQEIMALQTSILMNIVRSSEDMLGETEFIHIRHKMFDVLLFPIKKKPKRTFCVLVQRPYDVERLVEKANRLLNSQLDAVRQPS